MSAAKFTTVACTSCEAGADMCEHRPCWPTPKEAQAIIDAGHGQRLMRDYWAQAPEDITILCPAIEGRENMEAPFFPEGRCTFLTADNLCGLHDAGLKPLEGRAACCKDAVYGEDDSKKLRAHIIKLWSEPDAVAMAEKWRAQAKHGPNDPITELVNMLKILSGEGAPDETR